MDYSKVKPSQVGIAVKLIYSTLALGLLRSFVETPQLPETSAGFVLIVIVLTLGVITWLAIQIDKGRNWARILYALLFVFGTVFAMPQIFASIGDSIVIGLIAAIQAILQAVALVLLFMKPSSLWFKSIKSKA